MGTRHVISVIHKGRACIAQYGQWDGYPAGQGRTIVEFLHKTLADPLKLDRFLSGLEKCYFLDLDARGDELDEINTKFAAQMKALDQLRQDLPFNRLQEYYDACLASYKETGSATHLSRDVSALILEVVSERIDNRIPLVDESNFRNDSVMCEWHYTIDMDQRRLTVWDCDAGYTHFSFDDLPGPDEFVALLAEKSEQAQLDDG